MDSLVSTEWLANEMGASDLRIVDATKFLPDHGRNALAEYEAGHIPGAVFMDLEELVDSNAAIENTLPPAEKFASRMQSLGLGDGSRIVLYDDSPLKSSARAWFMLTMFGAHAVAILDGGIAKWKAEGRALVQQETWLECTVCEKEVLIQRAKSTGKRLHLGELMSICSIKFWERDPESTTNTKVASVSEETSSKTNQGT